MAASPTHPLLRTQNDLVTRLGRFLTLPPTSLLVLSNRTGCQSCASTSQHKCARQSWLYIALLPLGPLPPPCHRPRKRAGTQPPQGLVLPPAPPRASFWCCLISAAVHEASRRRASSRCIEAGSVVRMVRPNSRLWLAAYVASAASAAVCCSCARACNTAGSDCRTCSCDKGCSQEECRK